MNDEDILKAINDFPTGEWTVITWKDGLPFYGCSNCNTPVRIKPPLHWPYCPYCGAYMTNNTAWKGEKDEKD